MSYHNIPTKKNRSEHFEIVNFICYYKEKLTNSVEYPIKDLIYKVTGMRIVYPCRLKSIVYYNINGCIKSEIQRKIS